MNRQEQINEALSQKIVREYKDLELLELQRIADDIFNHSNLTIEERIRLNVAITLISYQRGGVKYR